MPDASAIATGRRLFFDVSFPRVARDLSLVLIAAFGLALQLNAYPNHDVAWVLWGTREMLEGAVFGRDIIEPNPPLAWYLAMPSTWIAAQSGVPVAAAFQLAVAGFALASVTSFDRILRLESVGKAASHLPTLVAGMFIFVLVGRDFGQREHLMLIAVLPYLALVAARCRGKSVSSAAAITIGISAGLGFALKPYFLAVPLLIEGTALLLVRRWTFTLRPEVLALGATVGLYAVSIVLQPDYLTGAVPLARQIYWSFDLPLQAVLLPLSLPLTAGFYGSYVATPERTALPLIMAAALAGFAIACIVQHKGYSYHLLPVSAGAALLMAVLLNNENLGQQRRFVCAATLALLLASPAINALKWWNLNAPAGSRASEVERLVKLVDEHAANGRFLAVAVHPYPAFPTALYTQADHVSRTNSQWFLPAVVQLRTKATAATADELAMAERKAREFILNDLARQPDVVIIDSDSSRHTTSIANFDFVDFYLEDQHFRAAWSHYRETAPQGDFRIFVRLTGLPR